MRLDFGGQFRVAITYVASNSGNSKKLLFFILVERVHDAIDRWWRIIWNIWFCLSSSSSLLSK